MGDSWGTEPQGIDPSNSWPVTTHEDTSNSYTAPRNDKVDDHGRPPNRGTSPVGRANNRDFESGSQITNKERAPSSHSREQIRYKDDRAKRSSENGDWISQNRPLERKDDNFNPRQKSYQTSNYDDRAELYETGVPSQKGFNDNNLNSGRSPIPTDDYDKRRDPRNSRGSSLTASHDRMNNVLDSHKMHSPNIQRKLNKDEETTRAEDRSIGDDFERRDEKKKSTGNQDWRSRENRIENSTGDARSELIEKRFKDEAVQTEPIDVEPIVQLINSKNPELGDAVRKKLFLLGFGRNTLPSSAVPTQGRSLLDMGPDELGDYEKRRGNMRKDFNDSQKSQSIPRSTHSPGLNDVSRDLDNSRNSSSKTGNDQDAPNRFNNSRNSYTAEYESQQPSSAPASRINEQGNNSDGDLRGSQNNQEPFKEPWETQDNKPRRSEMRAASPDNIRRPLGDRDVSSNSVASIRGSPHPPTSESRWNQMENQKRSEFRNHPNESSRVGKQENDSHLEYESHGYKPNAGPRTSSRDVNRPRDSSISSRRNDVNNRENDPHFENEPRGHAPKVDPRNSSPHNLNRPRDSSISSKVSQQRIEAQKNIDPQEVVVNKPLVEKNKELGGSNPPSKDSWDSGPKELDWRQKAALFQQELTGNSVTGENDRPAKKEPEPWEKNQKSNPREPWETTTHNDNSTNLDVPKNNGRSGLSANNSTTYSFENVGNRIEKRDDHYSKSSAYNSDRTCHNCNKTGHISRECPEQSEDSSRRKNCHICNKPGHLSYNCPESNYDNNGERSSRGGPCYTCGSHDHISTNCPSKTKPSPFVNPEPSGVSAEEAWDRLLKADQERDMEDFKKWLEEFAKASPNETFQSIERKLRSHECTGRIFALKREGIPFNSCLVDLQGNIGKTYLAQPMLENRLPRASGTCASSEKENFEWLADAGFLCDDPSPACFNCKQKGHNSRQCPMPKKENERPGHLACQHCNSYDHMTRNCDRRDRNERPYEGHGYGAKDTRGQSGYNRREYGRSDRFSDNDPHGDGTYGGDDRKYSSNFGSHGNDGRGGNRRRDYIDEYSTTSKNNDSFNKNRNNANQGSYHNDDKNFNRNKGDYNDGYPQRDFNDRGRYSNPRGNNGNRDRGEFGMREDRNSANRGYNDSYSRSNREPDNYLSRNQQDRSRDGNRDGIGRGTDNATQKWDTRNRSISINRSNNDIESALKKDTNDWDRAKNDAATSWNRKYGDDNSWREDEKKKSYGNNDRFENQRPRGNNNDDLRGRSAQTKEVLASNSGSRNESTRNSTFNNDRNHDFKAPSNIDNVQAWW